MAGAPATGLPDGTALSLSAIPLVWRYVQKGDCESTQGVPYGFGYALSIETPAILAFLRGLP